MRRLILIAAMSALVLAKPKPETYKETEDFQYSRSSSDDGSKSGYYGAQRGNVGGNYERAHNMDNLAQHQMSGLVRQVDGELGEGANTRTGSVYTAANSRGIYGSGNYDLSNLKGRNFAEGQSFSDSQSHSSQSSQNSRYTGQSYSGMDTSSGFSNSHAQNSRYRGYQTSGHADQRQIDNLQAVGTSQGLERYDSANQAGYNMNYNTQFSSHGRNDFDQSSANLHSSSGYDANSQAQYITTPVRVVLRPGGRVAIPISASTVSQNVLSENKNAINTDAEILNQHSGVTPTNKVKQYEASYSYRKQWEKHHELPGAISITVPTENPFPKNSELYDDAQLLQSSKNQFQDTNSLLAHSSNINSDRRAYTKSAGSSRSRLQAGNTQQSQTAIDLQQSQTAGFNSHQRQSGLSSQQSQSGLSSQQGQSASSLQQHQSDLSSQQSNIGYNAQQSSASSDAYADAYGRGAQTSGITDLTNVADDVNLKPKSYHSSYSYHKSWERQGDPYVIKPVSGFYGGQAPERLTAASSNSAAYSSHQYGSHSRQAHQSHTADCDDAGHVRVARSYDTGQQLEQDQKQWEDLGQQAQSKWENVEDLGQQQESKWDNLQDLGQQTQNQWDNLQQLGQETQNQWDGLQQLGQQTQNQWDNLQQLGQQTQNKWDNLEGLSQQTQRNLEQHQSEHLEDFGENPQKEEVLTNFEQQTNSQNENLGIFSEHGQTEDILTNFEQQANSQNESLDIFSQHSQKENSFTNFEQQANSQSENLDIFSQHSQKDDSLTNFEQQASSQNENLDIFSQHSQKDDSLTNFEQQASSQNENLDIFGQNGQKEDSLTNFEQQVNSQNEYLGIFSQHNQKDDSLTNFEQQANSQNENLDVYRQHTQKEDSLINFEQQANSQNENLDILNQPSQKEDSLKKIEQQADGDLTVQKSYTQLVNLPNSNNWNQISGLEPQSHIPPNVDFSNHQVQAVNTSNDSNMNTFGQSQQNVWYQPVHGFDSDKNIDSNDFMKPISQFTDTNSEQSSQQHEIEESVTVNDKPNLFTLPSNNNDYNRPRPQNTEQDASEDTNHYQNINGMKNYPYGYNFWHSNHFHNFNNQFENSFYQSTFSTSENGNPLQSLWDKIDNIGGDITVTDGKIENKNIFSHKFSHSQNVNHMQNGYSWNVTPNIDVTRSNTNPEPEEISSGHNNLFDESTQSIRSTVIPILVSHHSPKPEINAGTSIHTLDQHPIHNNRNIHSLDEGRGDIGPEETSLELTTADKPYKTLEEIETLSLTKATQIPFIQPSLIKNKDEDNGNNLSVSNSSKPENTYHKLFIPVQSQHTTAKINSNNYSTQSTIEPTLNVFNLNNNPLPNILKQTPQQQKIESVAIPEDVQQQNLEQQYEDFGQLQSSWFPINNLEQSYDQQNTDQQFEVMQPHEDMQDQTSVHDFEQQVQSSLSTLRDMQNQDVQGDPQQFQDMESIGTVNNYEQKFQTSPDSKDTIVKTQELTEPLHISRNNNNQLLQNSNNVEDVKSLPSLVETATENPGFWKTIGSKFSNAKTKVFSWFKSS